MKNEKNNSNNEPQNAVAGGRDSVPERRRVTSSELFGSEKEILIDHAHDEYRLRITSTGKLILTK